MCETILGDTPSSMSACATRETSSQKQKPAKQTKTKGHIFCRMASCLGLDSFCLGSGYT